MRCLDDPSPEDCRRERGNSPGGLMLPSRREDYLGRYRDPPLPILPSVGGTSKEAGMTPEMQSAIDEVKAWEDHDRKEAMRKKTVERFAYDIAEHFCELFQGSKCMDTGRLLKFVEGKLVDFADAMRHPA